NASDYVPDYFRTDATPLNNANTQYVNLAAPLLGILAPAALQELAQGIITVDHTALVFGAMGNGNQRWTFWYQKRAKVTRRPPNQNSTTVYCMYEPITQLWPGQAGHLCIRGNSK